MISNHYNTCIKLTCLNVGSTIRLLINALNISRPDIHHIVVLAIENYSIPSVLSVLNLRTHHLLQVYFTVFKIRYTI
jgi:hypothetical protein